MKIEEDEVDTEIEEDEVDTEIEEDEEEIDEIAEKIMKEY